jgi:hypothetical protein
MHSVTFGESVCLFYDDTKTIRTKFLSPETTEKVIALRTSQIELHLREKIIQDKEDLKKLGVDTRLIKPDEDLKVLLDFAKSDINAVATLNILLMQTIKSSQSTTTMLENYLKVSATMLKSNLENK